MSHKKVNLLNKIIKYNKIQYINYLNTYIDFSSFIL